MCILPLSTVNGGARTTLLTVRFRLVGVTAAGRVHSSEHPEAHHLAAWSAIQVFAWLLALLGEPSTCGSLSDCIGELRLGPARLQCHEHRSTAGPPQSIKSGRTLAVYSFDGAQVTLWLPLTSALRVVSPVVRAPSPPNGVR